MSGDVTPLMAQYFAIKAEHPHVLLLFQVGDFYELFFDDARTVAHQLALTLTKRGKHQGEDIPLCGIPVHALQHYLSKLVRAGFSIAVCDQMSKPVPGQVVKRGVTRVLTPGTLVDEGLLEEKSSSYLLACSRNGTNVALVFAELVTGQLFATSVVGNDERTLESELSKFLPDEIVVKTNREAAEFAQLFKKSGYRVTSIDEHVFGQGCSPEWCSTTFGEADSQRFLRDSVLYDALDTLVRYINKNNAAVFNLLNKVHFYQAHDYLMLDLPTQRNLDLIVNSHTGGRDHTLLSVLDHAQTSMGSRLIKKWIVRPLIDKDAISRRQEVVALFHGNISLLHATQQLLKGLSDLERIVGRIAMGRATRQDYLGVKRFLAGAPTLVDILAPQAARSVLLESLVAQLYVNVPLFSYLESALSEELGGQNLVKKGFDLELDELREFAENSSNKIVEFEQREVARTGISSLKVRYTDVFGFGIEITKSNYSDVPSDYIPQQTLANRTRYITQELKDLERTILDAKRNVGDVEKKVYESVTREVLQHVTPLRMSAQVLATLDALVAFASIAFEARYVRPEINDEGLISIVGGRHPVVEQVLHGAFVPNDTLLSDQSLVHIITGPNMGGKSTYLRQVALMCVMAHIGCFVPAKTANIALLDRVFTRIGSGDDLAGGRSTFWVEMEETSIICSQATNKSLFILDEVGRGTSTYDGMALAHAILEYFVQHVGARGLFATHYHELCVLADEYPTVKNYSTSCKPTQNTVLFLHKIIPGAAVGSFGIDIAKQAGLPASVIQAARVFLESKRQEKNTACLHSQAQLTLPLIPATVLPPRAQQCFDALKAVDVDDLSPRQALDLLFKIKSDLLA